MKSKNSKEKKKEKQTKEVKENKTKKVTKTKDKKSSEKKVEIPKTKVEIIKLKHIRLIGLILLLLVILVALILLTNKKDNKTINKNNNNLNNQPTEIEKEDEILEVYNTESNERPYAVMISNDSASKKRQYGIQNAYLIYEITVEGGITRLMAIFKDTNAEKIGPVRSSRHYYLDYVLESDAIYTHYGWSTYAESDISTLGIDNLNGLVNPSNMFWRDKNYSSPNNAYTSSDKILNASSNKKYRITSDDYKLLNYKKEIDISKDETYKEATNIKINYSGGTYVKYIYDKDNKYYLRYNNENKHLDLSTNEQVHTKNVIVLKIDTKTISNDEYGRQNLYNIGSGKGYYITNGQSIEITWHKESRESKTIYKNTKGEEISVNDGNTFIQIQPTDNTTTIE